MEYNINCKLVTGHDDFFVSGKDLKEWLEDDIFNSLKKPNTRNQLLNLPEQFTALKNWINSIQCIYKNGKATFQCNSSKAVYQSVSKTIFFSKANLKILSEHLIDFKKIYWKKGKIDHNDVFVFFRNFN